MKKYKKVVKWKFKKGYEDFYSGALIGMLWGFTFYNILLNKTFISFLAFFLISMAFFFACISYFSKREVYFKEIKERGESK